MLRKGLTMAAGYNRLIMIGNLTRDPDYKQLASGQPVCQLGVASNRQYRNKQTGEMVQEVCFVDVSVFGPQAESCKNYLQKGRPILVEGRLKFDSWESPEGQKRTKHSIIADRVVFLGTNAEVDAGQKGAESSFEHQEPDKELASEFVGAKKSNKTKKQARGESVIDESSRNADQHETGAAGELAFEDEPPFKDELPF